MRKPILFVLVLAIVLLAGAGLAAQDERVLVIGHAEQTDFYDPANGFTGTTSMVRRATYNTLSPSPTKTQAPFCPRWRPPGRFPGMAEPTPSPSMMSRASTMAMA